MATDAAEALGSGSHQRIAEPRGHQPVTNSYEYHASARASLFSLTLEPRRRVDRALWGVVIKSYVIAVSTSKMDEPPVALSVLSQKVGQLPMRCEVAIG